MADLVLIDGDEVLFDPNFGAAVVMVKPGQLAATGKTTFRGKKVCVQGNEKVSVPGCSYVTPTHTLPGTGSLEVESLDGHIAKKTASGTKKVLLRGKKFGAKFTVQQPAKQPQPSGPPTPDGNGNYSGKGRFLTSNTKFRGT